MVSGDAGIVCPASEAQIGCPSSGRAVSPWTSGDPIVGGSISPTCGSVHCSGLSAPKRMFTFCSA